MESEIKASLIALINGIKSADGRMTAVATAHLDGIVERCRTGLHPQLVHFLEQRSYSKALTFLSGSAQNSTEIIEDGDVLPSA